MADSKLQQLPPDIAILIQKIKQKAQSQVHGIKALGVEKEQQEDVASNNSAIVYGSSEEDYAFRSEDSSNLVSPCLKSSAKKGQVYGGNISAMTNTGMMKQTQSHLWQSGTTKQQSPPRTQNCTAAGFKLALNKTNANKNNETKLSMYSQMKLPVKTEFKSEMEFFLHYLWSQRGFQVENKTDEYHNLDNQQSEITAQENPRSKSTAHRASHFNRSSDSHFYRHEKPEYTNRVPISFNFQIPQTQVFCDGKLRRWYYSNELGQLKIHNFMKHDWTEIAIINRQDLDDLTIPSMIAYHNPIVDELKVLQDSQDGHDRSKEQSVIIKDYVSHHRIRQLTKQVNETGLFPKDLSLAQEMIQSANLKPAAASSVPGEEKISNVSDTHEIFEVNWTNRSDVMKIFRMRNILKRKKMHIASSKSQMTSQLKPIRQKHGLPNPAKAALLKLSMPQQLMYLSYEEHQHFAERLQIYPNMQRRGTFLDPSVPQPVIQMTGIVPDAHPKHGDFHDSARTSQSNFNNSPKQLKLMEEKLEISQIAEELCHEVQTAIKLIKAQFLVHQLRIEGGTFYFQWVHKESEPTREPTKEVAKRLYLIYVKDLLVRDKESHNVILPRRVVQYYKDPLNAHFYQCVLSHALLKLKERRHTEICSCRVQIDLQPQIKKFIANIFARMSAKNSGNDHLKYIESTILNALEFLLNINEAVEAKRQANEREKDLKVCQKIQRHREFFLEENCSKCVFCNTPFDHKRGEKFTLPFAHLIYMPQQAQFLTSLGESLPFSSQEKLLLSNKDLPPFLRLLIPNVKTMQQFQDLQDDPEWLDQQVPLSQNCFKLLSKNMIFLAEQSERLDAVKTEFQNQMLEILKKKATSRLKKVQSVPMLHRSGTNGLDQDCGRANSATIETERGVYGDSKSFNKRNSARSKNDSQQSQRASSHTRKRYHKAPILKQELYENAQQLGLPLYSQGGKRQLSSREIQQMIAVKQASSGVPIKRVKIQKKEIMVEEVSESDSTGHFNDMMEQIRGSDQTNQQVVMNIRKSREDLKLMEKRKGSSVVQFSNDPSAISHNLQLQQPQTYQDKMMMGKRSSFESNASSQRAYKSSLKNQLERINSERRLNDQNKGIKHQSFFRSQLVGTIVKTRINSLLNNKQKREKQRQLLSQMETLGDHTFDVPQQTSEKAIYDQISQPLFEGADFKSHRELATSFGARHSSHKAEKFSIKNMAKGSKTSRNLSKNNKLDKAQTHNGSSQSMLKQSRIFDKKGDLQEQDLKMSKQQSADQNQRAGVQQKIKKHSDDMRPEDDPNIVMKLLEKHVPDYNQRKEIIAKTESHDQLSQVIRNPTEISIHDPEIIEKKTKQRRQALVTKIKKLKKVQTEKNLKSLDESLNRQARSSRRLTIRELNCLDPTRARQDNFGDTLEKGFKLTEPTRQEVLARIPQLVQAQSQQQFEISRLTQDPIFGEINQVKILNADKIIKEKRQKDDPEYKESMKHFNQKIKHPISDEDFTLRQEHMRVKECENLLSKMGKQLQSHTIFKPAQVQSHREFDLMDRVDIQRVSIPLYKTKGKKSKKKAGTPAELKDQAYEAITMIEMLRRRENEIAIEEKNFLERKMSRRLTFVPGGARLQNTPKVAADGHFISMETKGSVTQRQPWIYNANPATGGVSLSAANFEGVTKLSRTPQSDLFLDKRATQMILMQNAANEQDAKNQLNVGDSLHQLKVIDRNIDRAGKIVGRSRTSGRLPTVSGRSQKSKNATTNSSALYKDIRGGTVRLGSGNGEVVAKTQRQATFVNAARNHQIASNANLRDLFR